MKLFFLQRTRLPPHTSRTRKKRPIFEHRLCFSTWSRLKSHDPISLKPHAHQSHPVSPDRTFSKTNAPNQTNHPAIIKSILEQDGGLFLRSHRETCGIQHLRLHQLNGNSTTIGSRTKVGILGDPHPGLNSSDFLQFRDVFSLARNLNSLAIDGGCTHIHLPLATFSRAQSLHTDDMCSLAQV